MQKKLMQYRHQSAFNAMEFTIVGGLLVVMTTVFVMTSKNLHINASLLSRMPSILPVDTPAQRIDVPLTTSHETPQQNAITEQHSSFSSFGLVDASCAVIPTIDHDGGITPPTNVAAHIDVVGSESTVGYRGPRADVHASISTDNGATWSPLFQLKALRGDETETVQNIPSGGRMLIRVEGRYGWSYQRKVMTGEGDARILLFSSGDAAPSFMTSGKGAVLFQKILTSNDHIAGKAGDIVILVELDDASGGDFQDAVLRLHLEKQECLSPTPAV